jgi:hypothetical protein
VRLKYKDLQKKYRDHRRGRTILSEIEYTNNKGYLEKTTMDLENVEELKVHIRHGKGGKKQMLVVPNEMYGIPEVKEVFDHLDAEEVENYMEWYDNEKERYIFASSKSNSETGHINERTARDWVHKTRARPGG